MLTDLERIVKFVYRQRKLNKSLKVQKHPQVESLACFLEDKLSSADRILLQEHLLCCDLCMEYLSAQIKIQKHISLDIPLDLLENIKKMVSSEIRQNLLEIFIGLKDKTIEIIRTTGDVLLGQELIPAPVLRSRNVSEFKEEVSILKDLHQLRILVKIQSKSVENFSLTVMVKDKQGHSSLSHGLITTGRGHKIDNNFRATLIREDLELESYISEAGNFLFESVIPGNYRVEISRQDKKEAVIDLKVKV